MTRHLYFAIITAYLQGVGYSAAVGALEAETREVQERLAAAEAEVRACRAQARAKDQQLDAAAAQVEGARQVKVQNGVRPVRRLYGCCRPVTERLSPCSALDKGFTPSVYTMGNYAYLRRSMGPMSVLYLQ